MSRPNRSPGAAGAVVARPVGRATPLLLVGLAATSFLAASMVQQAPGSLGPALTAALHINRAQLGLLTSAIWGGMMLVSIPAGVMADRFGERRVVAAGLLGITAVVVMSTLAGSYAVLVGLFLLASFGASFAMPGTTKAITAWAPAGFRGSALGFGQAVGNLGAVLAAALLPAIATLAGWGTALRASTIPALLVGLGFLLLYRERESTPGAPRETGRLSALVRNRRLVLGTSWAYINMGGVAACSAYVALYLNQSAGYTAVAAGAVLALYQAGGMLGRIGWAHLSDRAATREPVMAAVVLLGAGTALAMVAVPGRPLGEILAVVFLLGLSTNGWSGIYLAVIADSVGLEAAGRAVGASLTVSLSAMFVVAPAFGAIVDTTSYAAGWSALAAWITLSLVPVAGLWVLRRRPAQPA